MNSSCRASGRIMAQLNEDVIIGFFVRHKAFLGRRVQPFLDQVPIELMNVSETWRFGLRVVFQARPVQRHHPFIKLNIKRAFPFSLGFVPLAALCS